MSSIPWTKKYEPKSIDDLQLQNSIIVRLKSYVEQFNRKNKPLLLYGPPGTGKTVAAQVLAKTYHYELVELNASDFRDKETIGTVIGNASKQMSLFFRSKLILIDEVDALSGDDRGALTAIIDLLKTSPYPIILTANDPWDREMNKLRTACSMIMFDKLDSKIIASVLRDICIKENIRFQDDDLRLLAMRAGGDLRGAIIDLQTLTTNKVIDTSSMHELSGRMQKQSIMSALALLYKTNDPYISSRCFDNTDIEVNDQFNWIEENTALAYDAPEEVNFAYNYLSYADIFNRRIIKTQYWRFLVYISALSTMGVSLAKIKPYTKFFTFKETQRFLKMWIAKNRNSAKINFSKLVAAKTHCSPKEIYKNITPFKFILSDNNTKANFFREFDMGDSDIEFMFKHAA